MKNGEGRIPWPPGGDVIELFTSTVERALWVEAYPQQAREESVPVPPPGLLSLLADCKPQIPPTHDMRVGATYKMLAYIAHRAGMTSQERQGWYETAQEIGLTQRHAGHIIARLDDIDQTITEAEAFLEDT